MFLDDEGDVITRQYGRRVEDFEETLGDLNHWRELRKRYDGGDESVNYELLVLELDYGQVELEEALSRRQKVGKISKKQARELDAKLIDHEAKHYLKLLDADDKEQREPAGPALLAMVEEDRIPSEYVAGPFFEGLLGHLYSEGDAKGFATTLKQAQRALAKDRRYKDYLKDQQARLKKLKKRR